MNLVTLIQQNLNLYFLTLLGVSLWSFFSLAIIAALEENKQNKASQE